MIRKCNDIMVFLSLKNACTILLAKEKTWKNFLTVTVSYLKIEQKNKLCHFKTTVNWLFNPKTAGERSQDTSFLKISLNFLKSFRRYEEILCQY